LGAHNSSDLGEVCPETRKTNVASAVKTNLL